jgi:basic amino acid/polyamine antiporter, APA family
MGESWQPKPADRIIHPRRIRPFGLRRVLGIPGLFSIGYGDVGSSIYYALGVTALVALGATPIALGVAGLIYVFNALTYAEGSAMISEGGGSTNFSRLAFNDLVGFASGWLLMLTYVVTVAIAAYTIPPYLSYFWPALGQPAAGTVLSMGIILVLASVNILGVGEWSGFNFVFVTADIVVQVTLIALGLVLILIPGPAHLVEHMFGAGNWPSPGNLVFGVAIAALCFTGVESIAQHSEETRRPEKRVPLAYILMVITVLLLFAGISLVALSAMTPQQLGDADAGWARRPVAGIANAVAAAIQPESVVSGVESASARDLLSRLLTAFRDLLPAAIAAIASVILLMATNTGILGIARLAYSLSQKRQLPASLSRVHDRFRTPYRAIALFSVFSILLLVPGVIRGQFFVNLAALYVFGSLLVFASAHASILRLRVTRPDMPRPFKILGSIRVRGLDLPVTAILGLFLTFAIWWIVIIVQPYSWWIGVVWLLAGLGFYYFYRKSKGLPLTHLPQPPEQTRRQPRLH